MPKLVSNYGLVMLDGYFGNYTLSIENYNPGMFIMTRIYFFFTFYTPILILFSQSPMVKKERIIQILTFTKIVRSFINLAPLN